VVCTSSFFLKPQAILGQTMSLTSVEAEIGAYLWFVASLTLCLAYVVKSMPDKVVE
jgi:hypothetical protein